MLIINVRFVLDLNTMKIKIIIKLFKLKILTIDVDLLLNRFKVNNGKYKRLKLMLNQDEKYLISQIKRNILNKLYYDTISADIIVNFINPSSTALMVGIINKSFEFIKYYLLIHNADMDINIRCSCDFREFINKLSFNLTVYFTIFDMVYAIILSFYKRGKYVKEKRQ